MSDYNWKDFLAQWQHELEEVTANIADLRLRPVEEKTSSEDSEFSLERSEQVAAEIRQLEERLGCTLPPSFREFLDCHGKMAARLFSVSVGDIDWWKTRQASSWLVHNLSEVSLEISDVGYGHMRKLCQSDTSYLQAALLVVQGYGYQSTVYLLNPLVISEDGEWEAWSLSQTDLYLIKYPSFWEMMQALYAEFRERVEGCHLDVRTVPDSCTSIPTLHYLWKELLTIWSRALLKPGVPLVSGKSGDFAPG